MIIAIVGPTGIGKTTLSIALAKHLNTEIISGDSVQVYRGMNIGSAKVTEEETQGIVHHLIDILEPTESFSVALFQELVRDKIADFESSNKTPLIVGGTGLYIKSVLYDYDFSNTKRDISKEQEYDHLSNEELYDILLQKDPDATRTIHPNNRKRVLHAITRSTKNKMSANQNKDVPLYDFIIIGLHLDRTKLYPLINKRVDRMIESGLVEEAKHLYDTGISTIASQAIGYKELFRYFDGEWTLEEAIDKIKQHSRNLAKKQYTFFENQFPVQWFDVDINNFQNTISEVLDYLHIRGVK